MKYTNGPWLVEHVPNCDWSIKGDDGYSILAIPYDAEFGRPTEDNANATLISAAPELLRVAELILAEWEKPTEGVLPGELIARLSQYSIEAREAVKKARGES